MKPLADFGGIGRSLAVVLVGYLDHSKPAGLVDCNSCPPEAVGRKSLTSCADGKGEYPG